MKLQAPSLPLQIVQNGNRINAYFLHRQLFESTFNELYYPGYGQPGIQPERAKSVELGAQYNTDAAGLLRVTAFETRYDNLITSALQPNGLYLAQNVNKAKVQGIEASWRAKLMGTDVGASITFQNPVDEQSNTQLLRRARRHAAFDVGRQFGDFRLGGEWIISSTRTSAPVFRVPTYPAKSTFSGAPGS